MVTIPFVYFTLLLLFVYHRNKRQFDIACYIISIFDISAFFSILLVLLDLKSKDTSWYDISQTATFWYCFLLTICILPFIKKSNLRMNDIKPLRNSTPLKIIAWVSFFYFMLNLIMSFGDVLGALQSDLGEIRQDHYDGYGERLWFYSMPIGLRQLFLFFNIIFHVPFIMHFLAFYSLAIQKLPSRFVILFIVGSLTGFLQGILAAGRSGPVYWKICFGACYIFFYRFLTKNNKAQLKRLFFVVIGILISYVIITTIARFAGDNDGTRDSLISYAGQSFVNFCFFFDNFACPFPSLKNIFPLTYYLLLDFPVRNAGEMQSLLSEMSGYRLGVFYTFIGQIATSSSNSVAILYCILYSLLTYVVLNRIRNSFCSSYVYLMFGSVLYLGLFGHYYADYVPMVCVLFYALFFYSFR